MEVKESISTGRRVWVILAIIYSIMVLLLSAAGIIGTWIGRGAAIEVNTSVMEGVYQLAGAGRQATTRLSDGVVEIQGAVSEVEAAIGEVAQNISDKGLVMTLLSPEKEEKVVDTTDKIGETISSILSSIEAAFDLYRAIDNIPLVNLPKPDDAQVQELDNNVQEIQNSVDQLAADIQEFRDGAASEVDEISMTIGEVNDRLDTTNQNLSAVDSYLTDVQTQANEWISRFNSITTIASIVVSLVFIWVIFGMVTLIKNYWIELQ